MRNDTEAQERIERAARLKMARQEAGLKGPKAVSELTGVDINRYKAHESGRNGFGIADAKIYAKAFGVSLQWLNFNIGSITDPYVDTSPQQAEYLELLAKLPQELQEAQISALRAVVAALEDQSQPE